MIDIYFSIPNTPTENKRVILLKLRAELIDRLNRGMAEDTGAVTQTINEIDQWLSDNGTPTTKAQQEEVELLAKGVTYKTLAAEKLPTKEAVAGTKETL
jgi:hypothetical protein